MAIGAVDELAYIDEGCVLGHAPKMSEVIVLCLFLHRHGGGVQLLRLPPGNVDNVWVEVYPDALPLGLDLLLAVVQALVVEL